MDEEKQWINENIQIQLVISGKDFIKLTHIFKLTIKTADEIGFSFYDHRPMPHKASVRDKQI